MKNKVIIFTNNNARILVNPPEVEVFQDKPNAYVNPDLRFVKGVSPEHWKQVSGPAMPLDDAIRLQLCIGENVDWAQEHDTYEDSFYKKLHQVLEDEVLSRRKASHIMTKLLHMLDGVDRKEVADKLKEQFIKKSTRPEDVKDNQRFMELIKKWEHGIILPMSDDERKIRDSQIKTKGVDNTVSIQKRSLRHWWAIPILVVVMFIIWRWLK